MGDVLKKSPLESPMFKIMSNALASTETPQAINTLVSVIEARQQDEAVVMELLQILAITTKPTDKAINIVKKLAFSTNNVAIASTAQLALGGLSGNMKTINPEKADAVIDFLINKMHGQTDTFQEILVLGNTGSPKVLPIMKSYIYSSASPEIRAAAVASLRLVEQNEVQNLLASLSVSKDSILSKAAIETIDFRASH